MRLCLNNLYVEAAATDSSEVELGAEMKSSALLAGWAVLAVSTHPLAAKPTARNGGGCNYENGSLDLRLMYAVPVSSKFCETREKWTGQRLDAADIRCE